MARTRRDLADPDLTGGVGVTTLDRRELLHALQRMRSGDFSVRLPGDWSGMDGKIADTFNDIVSAKQIEMAEQLRENDRRKDEFLALLAHELRNPLAPVRNAVNIMRLKGSTDPDLVWCRDVIERQANQLTRLVDDLLDVSRITQGKIKLRLERLDLGSVIAGAVETSRPLIDAHEHELVVTLPDRPIRIEGDLTRLTQVLANLLNNAAKYQNERGRIQLTVVQEPGHAAITVRDQGVGIAPEMLSRVFELFAQGERAPDRAQGGLGIGLSLVKNLVELHRGNVRVASEGTGKGSEFTVRLPCLSDELDGQAPDRAEAPGASDCPPLRILVVDDSLDAAESLAKLLRLGGHVVQVAHDGRRALEIAHAEQPEVLLLDIGLPGMDGYELCRRVRQQGLGDALIIAMTGYGQERDRRRCKEAGFDTHTVKPVDYAELMKLLAARSNGVR